MVPGNPRLSVSRSCWDEKETLIVRISQVESRMLGTDGIVDVENVMLNGQAGNLVLETEEIPVRGEIYA